MKTTCAVVYVTSRLGDERHPQLDAILKDLSRIFTVTLVARTSPGRASQKRQNVAWREFLLPSPPIRVHGATSHFIGYARLSVGIRQALKEIRPQIIYAVNLDAFVATSAFISRQNVVIYHALEIYDQMPGVSFGRIWRTMEGRLLRKYPLLVSPSSLRAGYYSQRYKSLDQVIIWQNAPSIEDMEKYLACKKPHRQWQQDDIELFYPGGLGSNRDLVPLIKGIGILKQRNISCRLTILTRDNKYYESTLRAAVHDSGVFDRISKGTYIPDRMALIARMARYSYLVARYTNHTVNDRLCAPTKLVDAFLAGIPWIADAIEGTKAWCDEYGGGFLCNLDEPDDIAARLFLAQRLDYKISPQILVSQQNAALQKVRIVADNSQ